MLYVTTTRPQYNSVNFGHFPNSTLIAGKLSTGRLRVLACFNTNSTLLIHILSMSFVVRRSTQEVVYVASGKRNYNKPTLNSYVFLLYVTIQHTSVCLVTMAICVV